MSILADRLNTFVLACKAKFAALTASLASLQALVSGIPSPVTPQQFGAVGDGVTDDSAAFLAAIAHLNTLAAGNFGYGSAVPALYVPFGSYYLGTTTLTLTEAIRIYSDGGGTFGGAAAMLKWAANTTGILVNAPNCRFEGLALFGPWVFNSGALSEGEYHAIKAHWAFTFRDLIISGWQGDGVHANISAGSGGDTEGNANGMSGNRSLIRTCRNGLFLQGADTNAGNFLGLNLDTCRQWGIWDESFLGNTHTGPQMAVCGIGGEPGIPPTAVYNNGHIFYCVVGQETGASTNSPPTTATSNTWWKYWTDGAANSAQPQWVSGTTYRAGGALGDERLNGETVYVNPYLEGGQPPSQLGQNTLVVGGQGAFDSAVRYVRATFNGTEVGGGLYSPSTLKLATGQVMLVAGTQVVGARQTGTATNATDLATALTLVNDLKAKLIAHGLIS